MIKSLIDSLSQVIGKNKILFIILFTACFLRILGLIPNEYNADEPWVEKYSGDIFYNIITKGDFSPHDYKYGSFIFYLHALPHFPISFINYSKEVVRDIFFPTDHLRHFISFQQFIENLGPPMQRDMVIFWIQRAMTALLGGSNVLIIYFIVKKLFNKNAALLSAFLLAIMPLHVRESHYMVPDTPMVFFLSLAILFMVNLFQSGKWKWYILSGIMIGFSSTFKYFPLAMLAYPFAVILDKQKNLKWLIKIFVGLSFIPIGAFIGVPYLFLRSEDRIFFYQEMTGYVFSYYGTSITTYLTSLIAFLLSCGKTTLPSLDTLLPTRFTPYYLALIFFKGLGPIPSIISLLGMLVAFIKSPRVFIFLVIIPLFVLIYNSCYVHAIYERQADPLLPFLAIFIGIFLSYLWDFLKQNNLPFKRVAFIILLAVIVYYPLTQSFSSSWACGQEHIYTLSSKWISENIPENSTIAKNPPVSFPPGEYKTIDITPNIAFSLEEARDKKAEYAFINVYDILVHYPYIFDVYFFIPPPDLYKNNYVLLALYEYQTRATLLKELSRPSMCNQPKIVYYKIPPAIPAATNLIKYFSFDKPKDMEFWHFQEYSIKSKKVEMFYSKTEGKNNIGALGARFEDFSYTPPRIVTPKIKVKENSVYTFSGWIKYTKELKEFDKERGVGERDGFLRMDFYENYNDQVSLPGKVVALSPRTYGEPEWRKLTVTAKAPPKTAFMTLSLQVNEVRNSGIFYFDDLEVFGP